MKISLAVIFSVLLFALFGQDATVWLHPNKGQWDARIQYKVDLNSGEMLLENNSFTYTFWDLHRDHHDKPEVSEDEKPVSFHIVRTQFLNTNQAKLTSNKESEHYRNYFLGADKSKWKSNVKDVQEVTYENLYSGISMLVNSQNEQLKYSWKVNQGSDYRQIKWKYEGADEIQLTEEGTLKIKHSLGYFTESKPIAWIIRDGKKKSVSIQYTLANDELSFTIKDEIKPTDELIIDPSLTFSTFTGSTADNWGFTATGDQSGNLIAGGIVFAVSGTYPTTVGAFDSSNGGGTGIQSGFDCGITKFNASGTALLFSTFLGGSGNETPSSSFCDVNGELYVFGATSSANFPMTAGAFDGTFNGGPTVTENGLNFVGSDIYVVRFNATGTALIGSTFIGGSDIDGLNSFSLGGNSTVFNYGDQFRGEIIVDANAVYISSVTRSTDFPTLSPAQASLQGSQDAVLIKINKSLNSLFWSTYYGGFSMDSGNGLCLNSTGDVYLTGGTAGGLTFNTPGFSSTYLGGVDGYITRFNGTSGAIMSGTYINSTNYDQSYFVQTDADDFVYSFAQTKGTFTPTAGCFGNSNSGQLVTKFNANLSSRLWVTTIGGGAGHEELSPTAFLVSNCKEIYLSGWGGTVNQGLGVATQSTSAGLPATAGAYQTTTNGNNFWVGVFEPNMTSLKYGSYMGGTASSANHVDGGTSRFDKNGNIYHAVCAACQGNNFGFTTTPGVWSPQNPSPNCNLAAWKFELSSIQAVVGNPDPLICIPDPVVFNNNSLNGNAFFWDFGDGSPFSTVENPTHLYTSPGNYTVTLIVIDTVQCYAPDTITFPIVIGDFQGGVVDPVLNVCPGNPIQLEAFGGANYSWTPTQFLSNPTIANPLATVTQNTTFTCIVSDSCGSDTVQVQVNVFGGGITVSNDTTICIGNSVPLHVSGLSSATWSPATFLDNPTSLTPTSTPTNDITYTVSGTTTDGCSFSGDVFINVVLTHPQPVIQDTLSYCLGSSSPISVSGADEYFWSPAGVVSPTFGANVVINSQIEQYVYCNFVNACESILDSVYIHLVVPTISAGNDTIVCPGSPAIMWADGCVSYQWTPTVSKLTPSGDSVRVISPISQYYYVTGTDAFGCQITDSVRIDLFPLPFIQVPSFAYGIFGVPVQINAVTNGPGTVVWSPSEFLSCNVCLDPLAQPDQEFTYTVTLTDENGCTASDQIKVTYEPLIYVPNTFTPNGDAFNNEFFALGSNIRTFEIEIYNRWGELIYEGDALSKAWDGSYLGKNCPDGVYVWKINYTEFPTDKVYQIVGHVSLLR